LIKSKRINLSPINIIDNITIHINSTISSRHDRQVPTTIMIRYHNNSSIVEQSLPAVIVDRTVDGIRIVLIQHLLAVDMDIRSISRTVVVVTILIRAHRVGRQFMLSVAMNDCKIQHCVALDGVQSNRAAMNMLTGVVLLLVQ
jgi:hypothetical protein